jgi:hypothetical protein
MGLSGVSLRLIKMLGLFRVAGFQSHRVDDKSIPRFNSERIDFCPKSFAGTGGHINISFAPSADLSANLPLN